MHKKYLSSFDREASLMIKLLHTVGNNSLIEIGDSFKEATDDM